MGLETMNRVRQDLSADARDDHPRNGRPDTVTLPAMLVFLNIPHHSGKNA